MEDAVLRRIEKLVRLAASSHSDNERSVALAECVRIFDVRASAAQAARKSSTIRTPRRPAPTAPGMPHWTEATAQARGVCLLCSGPYRHGDAIWIRSDGIVIHGDCW